MKRILFFDFNIPALMSNKKIKVGGATVQTLNWINGLIYHQIKVGVIVEKDEVIPSNNLISFIKSYSLSSKNIFSWIYPRTYQLSASIRKSKPDYLVQAGAGFIVLPLAILAIYNKTKFIHRIANNVDVDKRVYKKISFLSALFYNIGLRLTPIISCQNEYQYNKVKSRFPNKKVLKFFNPYDVQKVIIKPLEFKARKYIAWIGIFQYQKNIPALYKIAKNLSRIEFKIAGVPVDDLNENLRNILNKLKNLKNVTFVGYLAREEISPFLSKALCLLNTSLYEGFPNTFLEAFAVGTPVATTVTIDPDQIIKQFLLGETARTPDELYNCILKIINNESYSDMSKRCLDYLNDNHDSKSIAAKLLEQL